MGILNDLLASGQSYWLDNLSREKITNGELAKRVSEQGLRGITSNPSIFNKVITAGKEYDKQIEKLVKEGKSPFEIYDALTIKDVQDACDILKPVFDQSKGMDGFVSLEVSPYLARDTQGSMREARRLHAAVGKANCLIKIPGTKEGIPAIEQMLYEGININVTLLFSVEGYEAVAQAYIRALERRVSEGKSIENIISTASLFISRIDVLTDQVLGQYIIPIEGKRNAASPEMLSGKAGIATARMGYQRFKEIFSGAAWEKLRAKDANVQRLLWASTGNKDPLYNDLRYVEPLIAKETINTLPDETIAAFADHGKIKKDAIEEGIEESKQLYADLKKAGIDLAVIMQQLENEGVQKFVESYNKLISDLANKRMNVLGDADSPQTISAGKLDAKIKETYSSMDEKQVPQLLFANDPYLWKKDAEQMKEISHRMGWISLPDDYTSNADDIISFATKAKEDGYIHAVLLGMGGSSLCSEVALETYGTSNGYLKLFVLDNTDPAAILDLENKIDIEKTIFIVASKSGNTEETLSFFQYFYDELKKKNKKNLGDNFIAITDGGTALVKLAETYCFRRVFANPPDLGGRYSVLSDFGLVPMALMGIDIKAFLSNAKQMETSCNSIPSATNPGISLGAVLGVCQRNGRDKVTFVLSSSINSFGYWVEQLLAESTGKEGRGLIPVNGEIPGNPDVYGKDRLFIHMYLASDSNDEDTKKMKALEDAGHPVVRIKVANKLALGGEYYRWEIAAAISGIVMDINPFDQPNVEESKKNTNQILEGWAKNGSFEKIAPALQIENISVYTGKRVSSLAGNHHASIGDLVDAFTGDAKPNDYIALLPYFLMTEERTEILQSWREEMRDNLKEATTLLNGPRYLHSTGQLHKGGPDSGLYIIIIGEEEIELAIPGKKFGFAILHQAQALGDFRSLDEKGRRVIRIHLGEDIDGGLKNLIASMKSNAANSAKK